MNALRSNAPRTTAVATGWRSSIRTSIASVPPMAGLIEPLTLWLAQTNAFIVAPDGPGGECVLIDAPPEPGPILQRLAELELRLVALISTHGHIDHVGGISSVVHAQDHDAPVHIHDDGT